MSGKNFMKHKNILERIWKNYLVEKLVRNEFWKYLQKLKVFRKL